MAVRENVAAGNTLAAGRSMTNVILIASEAPFRHFLRNGFEHHGFAVREAESATAGLRATAMAAADLIVLDVASPDMEGSEVLDRIRSWSNVPIIVLSTNNDENEIVRVLGMGADDYLVKPFGILELLARSDVALRRNLRGTNRNPVVRAGPLSVDLAARTVALNGERVQLTRNEYALLHGLAAHAGLVVTHQQLMKKIWGSRTDNVQYLRILVRKLRLKIEIDATRPLLIVNESGVGYRLDQAATRAVAAV
jgi:two-component system, OmpR family, KDP operon response regulator KdpE